MKKEDQLITEKKHKIIAYFLTSPGHYTRKMAYYPGSKPKGNHANPTHLLFIFRLKYFLESNNKKLYRIPYRSTQHKIGKVQAPTFTQTATASSHTQFYNVIWMC